MCIRDSAYTGAFSVYAALGGAQTTTLDLAQPCLDWARENFSLNGIEMCIRDRPIDFAMQQGNKTTAPEVDFGEFAPATYAEWREAVSYTHLDVYKRQARGFPTGG